MLVPEMGTCSVWEEEDSAGSFSEFYGTAAGPAWPQKETHPNCLGWQRPSRLSNSTIKEMWMCKCSWGEFNGEGMEFPQGSARSCHGMGLDLCPGRSSPKKPKGDLQDADLDQLSQSIYSPKSSLASPLLVWRSLGRWKFS